MHQPSRIGHAQLHHFHDLQLLLSVLIDAHKGRLAAVTGLLLVICVHGLERLSAAGRHVALVVRQNVLVHGE